MFQKGTFQKDKKKQNVQKITFNYDIFDGVPAPKRNHAVLNQNFVMLGHAVSIML